MAEYQARGLIGRALKILLLLVSASVTAVEVPPALAPWQDWVLREHPERACPHLAGNAKRQACVWPGRMRLEVGPDQGRFRLSWEVLAEAWLPLPGDLRHWPAEVLLNGEPVPVLERNGRPVLRVGPGLSNLSGRWQWSEPPQFLQLPPSLALIELYRDGQASLVDLDASGRLWLRRGSGTASSVRDDLEITVYRLLEDGVPLQLDTELRLRVSGRAREISVGQLLPADSEILNFQSPLPARIEADGRLRVQARAGEWRIRLQSRYLTRPQSFTIQRLDPQWPGEEVWSFRAAPHLRGVKLEGPPAIDPSQLDLPPRFAELPTYLMAPGQALGLVEQYRGDAHPAANRLSLQRTLWLDFDGGGATTRDVLSGTLYRDWRLASDATMGLGRVVVNGEPRLVTRLEQEAGEGIEIRESQVQIEAINRFDSLDTLSASGWLHDLDRLAVTLQLPPGWELWHASGPDRSRASWLSNWDLWDLFICLLIGAGLLRTLGWAWAGLGALSLALSYHEPNAPVFAWLGLVAALALLRGLPLGRLRVAVGKGAAVLMLGLLIAMLVFSVQQVRRGLYPQLELNQPIVGGRYGASPVALSSVTAGGIREMSSIRAEKTRGKEADQGLAQAEPKGAARRYRPDDNIQTGPGQPAWQWHSVRLEWDGPVVAGEPLRLYLSPPTLTRSLKILQVLLMAALFYGLARAVWREGPLRRADDGGDRGSHSKEGDGDTSALSTPVLLIGAALLSAAVDRAEATDFPPKYLLDALRETLLRAPECAPACASLRQATVKVEGQRLELELIADIGAEVALPLPADNSWEPLRVVLGTSPRPLLREDGKLWLRLAPGVHRVNLSARAGGESIAIPFPLKPHALTVEAPGWRVHGWSRGRLSGDTLQLEKIVRQSRDETLLPDPVPPFVRLERRLVADIDWDLVTRVVREAPATGAINVRVPLVPGESVVSSGMVVEDGHVVVTLAARQNQIRWRSRLPAGQPLSLSAAQTTRWTEHWFIEASPRWSLLDTGLTPIKTTPQEHNAAVRVYRPWPGESLALSATQPEAVPGPTTTVESVALEHSPGGRGADLLMRIELRSSLGGEYRFPPPTDAELQSLVIDGVEQALPKAGGDIVLPVGPGVQSASLRWRLPEGVALMTRTPSLDLPSAATNVSIKMNLPRGRWPLLLNGPDIGPAMLYWGVLVVILALALVLARLVKRFDLSIPLGSVQWLLLAIGMSTVNMIGSLPVVAWFFAMEARRRNEALVESRWFNLVQLGLIGLSLVALVALFSTIPKSLLSVPEMQVLGNGSSSYVYRWYQDSTVAGALPQAWVFSLPLWVYRLAMLAWSLWLVLALMRWLPWGWQSLCRGTFWKSPPPRRKLFQSRGSKQRRGQNLSGDEKPDPDPGDNGST